MGQLNLDEKCPECNGVGWFYNEAWDDWDSRHSAFVERDYDDPKVRRQDEEELEALRPTEPPDLPCNECDGLGWRPTDAGDEILRFLKRHQREGTRP